jgi:hypothetical protein
MKLTTTTQVTVDGVMQANGGPSALDPGFDRGGWARPLFDSESMTFVDQVYQRADAFLFGRRMQPTDARDMGDAPGRPTGSGRVLKEVREAVSDRDRRVRRTGERPPTRGARTTGDDLMQYLVSVIDDTAGLATQDEMAAIDTFNDRLKAEGHWVFAGGLGSPSSATVVDNRGGGEAVFTDGPFVEAKEYLAGFWIMEAPDLDVALKLAAEGSKACNRKIEVRPFL